MKTKIVILFLALVFLLSACAPQKFVYRVTCFDGKWSKLVVVGFFDKADYETGKHIVVPGNCVWEETDIVYSGK